jgi:hypothetical protein
MLVYKYSNIASGALSAHPIEDEIINIEDEESISYKIQLYSRQNAKRLLPSGASFMVVETRIFSVKI